jgi:hypothetical protein
MEKKIPEIRIHTAGPGCLKIIHTKEEARKALKKSRTILNMFFVKKSSRTDTTAEKENR